MFIHTFVFCWTGKTENALKICRGLFNKTDRLTVLDASAGPTPNVEGIEWIKVDPEFYYGMKFRTAVDLHQGDILLQVQEDAVCDDWGSIIDLCRERFSTITDLGIWSPDVNFTSHTTDLVDLGPLDDANLSAVVQTDCIVWAFNRAIVKYLRTLDYSGNNLGWGIDWAASAYAFANRMLVVRDFAAFIRHAPGSGYRHAEAQQQMLWFLSQLSQAERLQYTLLNSYYYRSGARGAALTTNSVATSATTVEPNKPATQSRQSKHSPPNDEVGTDGVELKPEMNPVVYALALLTPFDIDKPKARIGPETDGGYIFVDNIMPDQTVISYGISTEYRFEEEMARRGHKVYMFDHTIDSIRAAHETMKFYREGVSGISRPQNNLYSIEDHLRRHNVRGDRLLLKMDVEGAEIDAIGMASEVCLARFEQITLEIHGLVNLNREGYRTRFVAMFTKLNKLFTLFHVHANNHDGPDAIHAISGCPVSDLLELSYVRTESVRRYPSRTLYPTPLDFPNVSRTDKLLWFYPFLPTHLKLEQYATCEQHVAKFNRLSTNHFTGPGTNVALNKPAIQSSLSEYSLPNDARGGVNGIIDGSYGFHTQKERQPWWQIDLEEEVPVEEVIVFNRLDAGSSRAYSFKLKIGRDSEKLEEVYAQNGRPFGGADGNPARIKLGGTIARFVRIELPDEEYLHLDQVEVYASRSAKQSEEKSERPTPCRFDAKDSPVASFGTQ
jgi:hypothetical protein